MKVESNSYLTDENSLRIRDTTQVGLKKLFVEFLADTDGFYDICYENEAYKNLTAKKISDKDGNDEFETLLYMLIENFLLFLTECPKVSITILD